MYFGVRNHCLKWTESLWKFYAITLTDKQVSSNDKEDYSVNLPKSDFQAANEGQFKTHKGKVVCDYRYKCSISESRHVSEINDIKKCILVFLLHAMQQQHMSINETEVVK
jgi:hypothetical protein